MLKLIQTGWCAFDLAASATTNDETAAATLVIARLFTDQEAPARRVPEKWDRRGWYKAPQAGSGLWHGRRQPLNDAARREAIAMIERALKVPALTNIATREITVTAGNVSRLQLEITGVHNGRKFLTRVPLSP